MGELEASLCRVEAGGAPEPDGSIRVVPPAGVGLVDTVVAAFTAHVVVAADVPAEWAREMLPADDLSAPLNPPFLQALETRLGRRVNNVDLVLYAEPLAQPPQLGDLGLQRIEDAEHPRVRRALRYRTDVSAWRSPYGVLILGRGLAGRWETAFEVDPAHRGNGVGRQLARAARHLVLEAAEAAGAGLAGAGHELDCPARGVWAQVAPANAASVRAALAAGYRPVGAEALLVPPTL